MRNGVKYLPEPIMVLRSSSVSRSYFTTFRIPIQRGRGFTVEDRAGAPSVAIINRTTADQDRKSTRLNSSHSQISYAVFCLKKKKKNQDAMHITTHVRSAAQHHT